MPTPQVTALRFAQGRTPAEWLKFLGSPENLNRPATSGATPRADFSSVMRSRYEHFELAPHQQAALKQLASLPNGPAKLLIIGEDWSSDCRRDMPTLARVGEAGGMDVRVFVRDNAKGKEPTAQDASDAAGNGDIMHQFLNLKNGGSFQSVPVGAFFTRDMRYIYHCTEYSVLYQKDAFLGTLRAKRPSEADADHRERTSKAFMELQNSPFFQVWASAAVDEIITNLWERVVLRG